MGYIKFILISFAVWRTVLFGLAYFSPLIPINENVYLNKVWGNFDGIHYLNIARDGYLDQARFFPLYPLIIYLVAKVTGDYFLTALILANLFFLLGLLILYKTLLLDYKDETCKWVILFILAFPTAFFFGVIYSESLFLILLASVFYFARKKKFLIASLLAILLTVTRLVGVFIIPYLMVEIYLSNQFKKGWYLLITLLGIISYSIFNFYKWGEMFKFITAHGELNNGRNVFGLVFPLQTIFRYFKILYFLPVYQFDWWIALFELGSFVLGVILLFLAFKYKVRSSYLIFSVLAFLPASFSGTFSGLPRYVLVLFPIFIALALVKSKIVKWAYLVVAISLQMVMFLLFARGYYIA